MFTLNSSIEMQHGANSCCIFPSPACRKKSQQSDDFKTTELLNSLTAHFAGKHVCLFCSEKEAVFDFFL